MTPKEDFWFLFPARPLPPPHHCQRDLRMILLYGSPHPCSGSQHTLTDRRVSWRTIESPCSKFTSSGIGLMAVWKGRMNHSGLRVTPAICSHRWQRIWLIASSPDPQLDCGFFMGKDPALWVFVSLRASDSTWHWCVEGSVLTSWREPLDFSMEMSCQCMQFQSYVTWKNWMFYVSKVRARKFCL